MADKIKRDGLHKGHRERLRNRYLASGFDGFSDHEILELLLFYSLDRVNTNETAHLLMNRFRSLSGVLNAGVNELVEVPGIGISSAILLNMMPKLFGIYEADLRKEKGETFNREKIVNFLRTHYIGETVEHSLLMLFDQNMRLIETVRFDKGTANHCTMDVSVIAEYVFTNHAAYFAVAHNHPNGSAKPSYEDISFTRFLNSVFDPLGKMLIDHYVVTMNEVRGIILDRPTSKRKR